ncbi:MAG TPA: hypothetical protein VIF14_11550 [Alphaproteobacteria bacterium]|jgi:hypothetical protein
MRDARRRRRSPSVCIFGALGVLLAAAGAGTGAFGQDATVQELMRKVAVRELENGFCSSVPWQMTDDAGEHRFLENAAVGSAEAARFPSGACSYTYVTQVYPGSYGRCVRYTWWACGPGKTCASGETVFCKNPSGGFSRQ